MSCGSSANRLAHLVKVGISALSSKRGFYAGVALRTAGLAGAGLVAVARRRQPRTVPSQSIQPQSPSVPVIRRQPLPQLRSRLKVEPIAKLLPSERCANCQTPAGSKPGSWYFLGSRMYCPDCAPEAANRTGVDLVSPVAKENEPALVAGQKGAGVVVSSASRTTASPAPLPPEGRVQTRLLSSRIGLRIGPNLVPINNGYVVLRPDGMDTGLTLAPAVKVKDGTMQEDTREWWLTHIPSGKSLPNAGPYRSPEQAQLLAGVLAQLDWTRSETELTTEDLRRAGATVTAFNTALNSSTNMSPQATTVRSIQRQRPPDNESLVGKILADGKGGVARVLEDRSDRLFMIDSLGERYEIYRNETRLPDESDFEICRVAMSFDPAASPEEKCAGCGRSTKNTGAGEMWYKMSWKPFCGSCAARYAASEGYAMEEEIGDTLELSR